MVKNILKHITLPEAIIFSVIMWSTFLHVATTQAVTTRSPGALLQPGDVTGSIIRDRTITGDDISLSATIRVKYSSSTQSTASSTQATTANFSTTTSTQLNVGYSTTTGKAQFNEATFMQIPTLPASDPTSDNQATRKAYVDSKAGGTNYGITAGMKLTAKAPVMVATTTYKTGNQGTSWDTTNPSSLCRDNGNGLDQAVRFTVPQPVLMSGVQFNVGKTGTPTQTFKISIETDNAGKPSGTALIEANFGPSDVPASAASTTFNLPYDYILQPGITYHLVWRCNANDGSNYYTSGRANNTGGYSGMTEYWQAGVWNDLGAGYDWAMGIVDDGFVVDRIYQAYSVSSMFSSTTPGVLLSNAEKGSWATVRTTGVMEGYSGLTTGQFYFLQDLSTSTATTIGTIMKKIGYAISSTTIKLNPNLIPW